MKEILFEKCAYYGELMDAFNDEELKNMYLSMWSSLYEVISECGLAEEFAQYQISR